MSQISDFARVGNPRILVLGDLMLDRYTWGNAPRVSPEALVLVLEANHQGVRLCCAPVYFKLRVWVCPSDTDPDQKLVTSFARTFHPGTCQPKIVTTTLPAVPVEQNGSGVAATRQAAFDIYGHNTWNMDERGFITLDKLDVVTGATTQHIGDVDTAMQVPKEVRAGWETPAGGGKNVVTDFQNDAQGQQEESLSPPITISLGGVATVIRVASWTVRKDATHEVWTAEGFATGSAGAYVYTLMNPLAWSDSNPHAVVVIR